LQAQIRELEEGTIALALASPPRRLPAQLWQQIEGTVAQTARWRQWEEICAGWWRSGWAAAAACLVGWGLYAFWMNRPGPVVAPVNEVAGMDSRPLTVVTNLPQPTIAEGARRMQFQVEVANQ
jgi:hypothetical protein